MTMTEAAAFEAMLAHHRVLTEEVNVRVAALTKAVCDRSAHEVARADLVAYLADEVLPHALAEELTIYQVAGASAALTSTVDKMVSEHRSLALAIEQLANAPSGPEAAEQAEGIAALFDAHVTKENDVLLPALLVDDGFDLALLLVQMHQLTEAVIEEPAIADDSSAPDLETTMLSLLLNAASDLARVGEGDRACAFTASAWAALRAPRPELAVRATAALHRLVRLVTSEPVSFRSSDDGHDPDLDVRGLAPAHRHQSIFNEYDALEPGAGFVLVNDHDPKPLRYQFEAENSGGFTWDYIEAGPQVWRVRIGRAAESQRASVDQGGCKTRS